MISQIELREIRFHAFHGVCPQETVVGNQFVVNILLTVSLDKAMTSDNLDDTINYATVYELTKQEMAIRSKLLEHVAYRIVQSIKARFPQLAAIELSLSKQNPPIGADIQSTSIILKETYR